jgi:phosphoenolpyruvate-protein kinase (PTS system EI component)
VLRLIASVVAAAHQRAKRVGLCGELASDLATIPVLVGLGLDELSMSGAVIPLAKHVIRTLTLDQVQDLARRALEATSADEVLRLVAERVPAVREFLSRA